MEGQRRGNKTRGQNDPVFKSHETAKKVASQVGKSEKTVRRYDKEVGVVEKAGNITITKVKHGGDHGNQYVKKSGKSNNVTLGKLKRGNAKSYTLDRLKLDPGFLLHEQTDKRLHLATNANLLLLLY